MQVLGFNPRHRKGFLNSVMRYGMPPPNAYHTKWKPRELKSIPENAFKLVSACVLYSGKLSREKTFVDFKV